VAISWQFNPAIHAIFRHGFEVKRDHHDAIASRDDKAGKEMLSTEIW
jgi:hypothetical protein